ncbi:MAG: hypothetical protein LBK69_06370 [Syntrophomonadaceae bacterium]|jgi:hypothetical protein|nr:hypothetical protein [Syntrophomonadaceae bacterium]
MSTGWIIVLILIILLYINFLVKESNKKRKAKEALEKEMKARNATLSSSFKHVAGLPIPENTICQVYATPKGIEIVANGQQFNLAKEKIIDVSKRTDVEIQKQLVSSAGGAVGGALLFGPVGALIGGRTKTKDAKKVSNYLIFTYQKDDEPQYVGFDIENSTSLAEKFVKEFQQSGTKTLTQKDL